MTILLTLTLKDKHYSFVDSYSNDLGPLPGDYVTFPVYAGFRSNCANNICKDCAFRFPNNTSSIVPCQQTLINSELMLSIIPDHIKLSHPEFFI